MSIIFCFVSITITSQTTNFLDLFQRPLFWRRLWVGLFLIITGAVCIVQRQRLIPLFSGISSLYYGRSSDGVGAVSYQRVSTTNSALVGSNSGKFGPNYSIGDVDEDDDE